jgi:ferredoxin-NADP reductase
VERAALPRRLTWQLGTVAGLRDENARTRTIALDVPDWPGHRAGQHVDVRLTAEDGYQAQRSYSIASAPGDDRLELTVERLDDGEVSPYLTEVLVVGDELELRGPIGGYFVWEDAPLLLVAGGSGVVPFRSMLRHHRASGSESPVRLLYSARTLADVIYRDELMSLGTDDRIDVRFTLTREQPDGWDGYAGRVDRAMLEQVEWPPEVLPLTYVCGPTGFVETVAGTLVELGHPPGSIRTERFGGA